MNRTIPKKYQLMYSKKDKSRKCAIRCFCIECMNYVESEVKECSDKECSLYKWRLKG